MNFYILLEGGKGAKSVYKRWIPYINKNLRFVNNIGDINNNDFFIFMGKGNSEVLKRIPNSIEDMNANSKLDRLVIIIDSEEDSATDKLNEINEHINNSMPCEKEIKIVLQHFCFETWLLGNKRVFNLFPNNDELKSYYKIFNIRENDPEDLPGHPEQSLNRAQFAYEYLRAGMQKTKRNGLNRLSYTKRNPGVVVQKEFFNGVKRRFEKEHHIKYFDTLLEAFQYD